MGRTYIQFQEVFENKDFLHSSSSKTEKYLTPFQRNLLESELRKDVSPKYRQRLQIMLMADDGKCQAEICRALGCSPATARHWTIIARSGKAHNWRDSTIGRPKAVSDQYLERLKELVTQSPRSVKVPHREYTYHQHRWTAPLLSQHLQAELGIEISDRHINRLLKQMRLSVRSGDKYNQRHSLPVEANEGISIRDLSGSAEPKPVPATLFGFLTIG